jgi:tripartite ATP-independent transporter DctM subunit
MLSSLGKPVHLFEKTTNSVARLVNRIGAGVLALMMFMIATDVCARYFFNASIIGGYEVVEFMMAVVVTFGFAYAVSNRDHIIIDLLSSKFPPRTKALINTATCVLIVGILFIITWRSLLHAKFVKSNGLVSESLLIPIYPFVYVVAFSFAIFCLMELFNLRKYIIESTTETRRWAWSGLLLGIFLTALSAGIPQLREITFQLTPFYLGILGIILLFVFTFSGMYLGATMCIIGFLGFIYIAGINPGLSVIGVTPYRSVTSYTFSVIPLFILMGTFCFHSGLSEDLYDMVNKFIGHFSGGLAMATVGACACFAAVSGSGMATVATMGKVALPEMRRYKYDLRLAAGSIAAGGSIGILIPPSTILVIYGILTQQSIGKLFLAGFIPGIIEALFYIAVIGIMCKRNPNLGPKGARVDLKEKTVALKSTWGVLALFVLVIGGIYFGIFTPTEAAGVGAFGALIFTILRRRLNWQRFASSLEETVTSTSTMFFILVGAMIFGSFLTITRLPFELTGLVADLAVNRYIILACVIVIYLFIGAFLDIFSIVVITIPIIAPIMEGLGFDLIWFGIIVVRLFEMGAITPPIGINVFVLKGVAKDVPFATIYKGIIPFFIADLLHVGLLIAFPGIVTFLPSLMK